MEVDESVVFEVVIESGGRFELKEDSTSLSMKDRLGKSSNGLEEEKSKNSLLLNSEVGVVGVKEEEEEEVKVKEEENGDSEGDGSARMVEVVGLGFNESLTLIPGDRCMMKKIVCRAGG